MRNVSPAWPEAELVADGAIAQAEDAAEVGEGGLDLVHGHQHRDAALAGFLRQGLDDLLGPRRVQR